MQTYGQADGVVALKRALLKYGFEDYQRDEDSSTKIELDFQS